MIAIQEEYIAVVLAAKPRLAAMVRGKARKNVRRALIEWGFTLDQQNQIIDDADDMIGLNRAANQETNQ